MAYAEEGVPLVILAGKEYGSGSSRDWAAKGTKLLGVGAVIAETFERIHRSNLIGMGVLPLQFADGESGESSASTARRPSTSATSRTARRRPSRVTATAERGDSGTKIRGDVRLDTPNEVTYFKNGGILQTVLRNLR